LPETIRTRGLRGAVLRCAPDRFKGAAEFPPIKAYPISPGSKISLDRGRAEHATDQPAEQQWRPLAAPWHATTDQAAATSGKTSRADFAWQFGGKSDLFCELINIAQRLNSQKIHVRPPTHQHANADVTIVQMSQGQKNL
jgi:hypothetical protein